MNIVIFGIARKTKKLEFLGTPVIALLLSTICAMLFLGLPGGFSIKEITNVMTNSLHYCGNIILLISGGGSWMVKGDMIKAGEFEKIKKLTQEAKELAE